MGACQQTHLCLQLSFLRLFIWRCSAGDLSAMFPAVLLKPHSPQPLSCRRRMLNAVRVGFRPHVTSHYLPPSVQTDWRLSPVHIKAVKVLYTHTTVQNLRMVLRYDEPFSAFFFKSEIFLVLWRCLGVVEMLYSTAAAQRTC